MNGCNEKRLWIDKMEMFGGGTPTCETCVYWEEQGGGGFFSSSTHVCTNTRSPEHGKEKGKDATCNYHGSK